ncbi:RagB/SusD family nutrient uptake outer membrane protein [Tamlana sp. 2201CG12-4]|uniref:RagB/SusD family nutrient uptake outer membrane protein n=1 Tax=Tamlana sp. 2201CG12-4 TaxID=3112582 RepID=UPI002DB78CC3|nr:RagB/SusD family nutrient uptake outer membrane protein [Tamlana sp. 2201CG12-4]MEC3907166.1 RagB/SusD family nutrient uptake outer membrane protein [Tamlana sp. 2201CG12-4]
MKKINIKYIALVICLSVFTTNCNDFIEETPESVFSVGEFYSNAQEAKFALAGIYSRFAGGSMYGRDYLTRLSTGADEIYYNQRFNSNWTISTLTHTEADSRVHNFWLNMYRGINLANLFEANLKQSAFSEIQANQFLAESRFLRAFAYFHLVSWFEEVPLRLEPTNTFEDNHVAPASLEQVYEQIISDFKFAAQHLPHLTDTNYELGRAHKMSAEGLLARVYLKMAGYPLKDTSKYQLAKDQCEIVMNDGNHGLTTGGNDPLGDNGYRNHFLSYIQNRFDTRESLFEIVFSSLREEDFVEVGGRVGVDHGPSHKTLGGVDLSPFAFMSITPMLIDLYDDNDLRKAWNIPEFYFVRRSGSSAGNIRKPNVLTVSNNPGKFRRWEPANYADLNVNPSASDPDEEIVYLETAEPDRNISSINYPILRYSDILLMYAEADLEINGTPTAEAIAALNQVRNRAGLINIQDANPTIVSNKQFFFNELVDERSRELCFESLRKMDLIRWELFDDKISELVDVVRGHPEYNDNPASSGNDLHESFIKAGKNFIPGKHLSLPYPLQETLINDELNQKPNW